MLWPWCNLNTQPSSVESDMLSLHHEVAAVGAASRVPVGGWHLADRKTDVTQQSYTFTGFIVHSLFMTEGCKNSSCDLLTVFLLQVLQNIWWHFKVGFLTWSITSLFRIDQKLSKCLKTKSKFLENWKACDLDWSWTDNHLILSQTCYHCTMMSWCFLSGKSWDMSKLRVFSRMT